MSTLRGQRGFNLPELLIAMAMFVIILLAVAVIALKIVPASGAAACC